MSIARLLTTLALATLAAGTGCKPYRGAIYSSYQETGLGIRTTAQSEAPVKVHVGYNRSVAAFVPRRGSDAQTEEATALIAKDEVRIAANPTTTGTANLLAVDSAFITGTAAIVASAPSGAKVKVESGGVAQQSFTTTGSAGDRIATALTGFDIRFKSDNRGLRDRIVAWLDDDEHTLAMINWLPPEAPSPGLWVEQATPEQLKLAIERFRIPASAAPPAE